MYRITVWYIVLFLNHSFGNTVDAGYKNTVRSLGTAYNVFITGIIIWGHRRNY